MDKEQALHFFWSGFGIPAIDEQSSYDEPSMDELSYNYPRITYEVGVGELDAPVTLAADLFYRDTSWPAITQKAHEIAAAMPTKINYDSGQLWIKRGSPIYQRMAADNTFNIRRIHFNIIAEYLSD